MLFRKKLEKNCAYCIHSAALEENIVLCAKKGVRSCTGNCRKFQYDPTKRIPKKAKAMDFSKYEKEDFTL